ncbi:XylR family transcriptional regulator [Rhodovulum sp. BSW8]|nr:ROK family transcriptional regulator [Rhodovulum sp. BSW8]RBO52658.1 XylR family transcriptional regulator [Rhodovulum sp. BSW8]
MTPPVSTPHLGPGNPDQPRGCGPLAPPRSPAPRPLRQQIFEQVRAMGEVSRGQLARELGVSPASVTTQTSELIEQGYLTEVPLVPGAEPLRGRPPVALRVAAGAHAVAGVKFSMRKHVAVALDFAGNQIAEASEPARDRAPLDDQIEVLARLIGSVCAEAGIGAGDLAQVGIGVPGFVDHASGRVHWSPVFGARDVDLAQAASARLGLPVIVDNDANLAALAELWFGSGRTLSDFAVVTLEHGLGMGLVLNHRVFRGALGLGVELGHTKVELDGALCRCGQRGCLEAYVADYALAREAHVALDLAGGSVGGGAQGGADLVERLYAEAKAGNAAAQSIFRRAGRYLALGLANVINVFDPELLILSGERMRYDYLHAQETIAEVGGSVLPARATPPRIEVHAWGDLLGAHGAGALALGAVTDRRIGGPFEGAAA